MRQYDAHTITRTAVSSWDWSGFSITNQVVFHVHVIIAVFKFSLEENIMGHIQ